MVNGISTGNYFDCLAMKPETFLLFKLISFKLMVLFITQFNLGNKLFAELLNEKGTHVYSLQ